MNRLCQTCRSINFPRHKYDPFLIRVRLGTWRKIVQQSFCPFCRLVVRVLQTKPFHTVPSLDDDIYLDNYLSWELGIERSPYDQMKPESYSHLRSIAKRSRHLPERLIVTSGNNIGTFIQYLVDQRVEGVDHQFLGRKIDRGQVELSLLGSWMKRCENYRDDICETDGIAGSEKPENLRLIDNICRTLVRSSRPSCLPYLTLSYVWGTDLMKEMGCQPVVLNRCDIRYDELGYECTPLPDLLPQTVSDAILLTGELGYRYLWVDALCIIQDDPLEDKTRHLERMDAVYNCSKLKIVAGSGEHAYSGLPGINRPRSRPQHVESVKGIPIAAMAPSFSELENSKSLVWNTRGWTFQEKILAKRLLLFTEHQVYFKCSESVWTEEIHMETEEPSKGIEA